MIKIAKGNPEISATFLKALMDDNDAELVMEVLFDCSDKPTQRHLSRVIRYMVCQLKEHEMALIESGEKEEYQVEEEDS